MQPPPTRAELLACSLPPAAMAMFEQSCLRVRCMLLVLATFALFLPAGSQHHGQTPDRPWTTAPVPPQYWQAKMRMVVTRQPPIPTHDPLFRPSSQQKEFERSLESDISMALSMRRESQAKSSSCLLFLDLL